MANTISYKPLLNQHQYLKLIAANAVGRFADSLDAIAFTWLMYKITGNPSLIALIMAFNYIPTVLFQPFAGVLVDRFSKKYVIIFCDCGRAVVVFLVTFLFLTNYIRSWILFPAVFLISTFEAFRMPAGSALVPKILDKENYKLGTALNQTLCRIVEAIGMACAGGIIAFLGSPTALILDAICFLFSGIIIGFIRYKETTENLSFGLKSYSLKLIEGFTYLKTNRLLLCLALLGLFINFVFVPINVFQAPYIGDSLKLGPEMLSVVGIILTLGMSLGAFLTPKLETYIKGKFLILASGVAVISFYMLLWLTPNINDFKQKLYLLLPAYALLGLASGIQNVIFSSSLMLNVKPELMGRISGIFNSIMHSIMPIGSFVCSALATFLPIPNIFLFTSIIILFMFSTLIFIKEYNNL